METDLRRSFEVDDQLEPGGLLDGKVSGFPALKNAAHIVTCAPEHGRVARPIGHEATAIHELPCSEQRGNRIFVRKAYNQFSVVKCQRIWKHKERVGAFPRDARKCF